MMTCSVNMQLTVSLAGISMARYLSLHLAVFTGEARLISFLGPIPTEFGRLAHAQ